MRRAASVVLLVLSACSQVERTRNGIATDAGIEGIAMPEEQLRNMLPRGVLATQSGPMHLFALGLDRGCDVMEEATDKAVQAHLPAWRANLVKAYRQNVPAPQLAQAVEQSPPAAQSSLRPFLPAVGSSMQAQSSSLLQRATVDVLASLEAAARGIDLKELDANQRQAELQGAMRSGQLCGMRFGPGGTA